MNTPKDQKAPRLEQAPREAFLKVDDCQTMHAHRRNRPGPERADSAKHLPRELIEKLTGDTVRLQQMLARLYPELARTQQLTANIRSKQPAGETR